MDGAFAAYYDQVAPWLGSGTGCTDNDGDSYCTPEDCDDANPDVNPGAAEVCNGIDDNCDGTVDEGCSTCTDADSDGYCAEIDDCDDSNPFVNPGTAEVCDDGFDNDCDGFTDGDDSDCAAACFPSGAACTSHADCCSGMCHPRKLTCK